MLEMMKVMSHILPNEMLLNLGERLLNGVPNCLYGDIPNEELKANLSTDNLLGAMKNRR